MYSRLRLVDFSVCRNDRGKRKGKGVVLARLRFVSLWVSQSARVLADCSLRIFVVLELSTAQAWPPDAAWHLVTALLMFPAVFLAPFNGALCNTLPKPVVLIGSAAYCLVVVALFGTMHGPWLVCWGLVAIGAAVYSPTRYALLPAAAIDAQLPLTRINAWIETATGAAIVAGFILGAGLQPESVGDFSAVLVLAAGLNLLAVVTALPVRFPSDVRRIDTAGQAVLGFFHDCRRVWQEPAARGCLLSLAALRGLVTALMGALVGVTLAGESASIKDMLHVGLWVLAGVALGSFLAGLERNPRRVLGLVPLGATALGIGLVIAAAVGVPGEALCVVLGAAAGLINVPLAATYQAALPADARGNGMAVRNFADFAAITLMSVVMYGLAKGQVLSPDGQLWLVALLAIAAVVVAWWILFKPVIELGIELVLAVFYRIKAHGPGALTMPQRGPLLIIANHSAWFDPLWLAKIAPRQVIPMMTSNFYDLPLLKPLMKLADVIRVQAAHFRREVPEIKEAVEVLDRGGCVILFPEGWMRRKEQLPLRQFGRGITLILKERPQTPVVVCWIEGGWGSYCSYANGPPTKNKRMDFRRQIDIAVEEARIIDPALLADPRALRTHLRLVCLEARRYLGLEPYKLTEQQAKDNAADKDEGDED
jgi:1-acyl-sn-glycerol-3-phosphate acyltransferase